jgi:hypothetical protein
MDRCAWMALYEYIRDLLLRQKERGREAGWSGTNNQNRNRDICHIVLPFCTSYIFAFT